MKPPMMKKPAMKAAPMKKAAAKMAPPAAPKPGMAHAVQAAPMHDEMKYKAQDALHTLKRAHEIKQDTALMEHVRHHAKSERNALASIARRKT